MAENRALSAKLNKHFAAIGAAAAAVTGLGIAQQAEAALVYSGVVNLNIPSSTNGLYLNVVTGANNLPAPGTAGSTVPGWDINPWSSTAMNFFTSATSGSAMVVSSGTVVANLTPGAIVDATSTFQATAGTTSASTTFALNSSDNLFGFRFLNENTGQTHFGWGRVSLAGGLGTQPRSLVEYAYNDVPGAGVEAGVVPEPTGLGLLAIGAAGLVARRRK